MAWTCQPKWDTRTLWLSVALDPLPMHLWRWKRWGSSPLIQQRLHATPLPVPLNQIFFEEPCGSASAADIASSPSLAATYARALLLSKVSASTSTDFHSTGTTVSEAIDQGGEPDGTANARGEASAHMAESGPAASANKAERSRGRRKNRPYIPPQECTSYCSDISPRPPAIWFCLIAELNSSTWPQFLVLLPLCLLVASSLCLYLSGVTEVYGVKTKGILKK